MSNSNSSSIKDKNTSDVRYQRVTDAQDHTLEQRHRKYGGKGPPVRVLALLLCSTFAMGIEYAILMPTVWKYVQSLGGSKTFLGIVLAGFSLTRTIAFPILGYWSDRRPMRHPYIFAYILGAIGMFLYGVAGGLNSRYVMLIGRLVAGVGAANTTLNQSYIARASPVSSRTKLLSLCRGCSILGIASGPLLNLLLLKLDKLDWCYGRFCIDSMTSAGYLMMIVNLVLCALYMLMFVEPPPQRSSSNKFRDVGTQAHPTKEIGHADMPHVHVSQVGGIQETKYDPRTGDITNDSTVDSSAYTVGSIGSVASPFSWEAINIVLFRRAGWWCLLINFITGFELTALETAITPITQDQYGWGAQYNSYLFAGITVIAMLAIISTILLDKRTWSSPRGMIALAHASMAVAFGIGLGICSGTKIPLLGLMLFGAFLIYGVVLMATPAIGVFTTMVGEYDKGVFMGYSQIVLGIARFLGPLFAGLTLEFHTHWLIMASLCAVYATAPLSFPFVWSRIVKLQEFSPNHQHENDEYGDVYGHDDEHADIHQENLLHDPVAE